VPLTSDVASPNYDGAGEGHGAAREQHPRKALAKQEPGEEGDQHRPDVHQHRRGPGVHALFGFVQHDVVGAEPEQPEHEQAGDVMSGR
jgi:hypothetical protein